MGRKKKPKAPADSVANVEFDAMISSAVAAEKAKFADQDARVVAAVRSAAHGFAFATTDNDVAAVLPVEGDVFTLRMNAFGARALADSLHAAAKISDFNAEADDF